MVLNAIANIIGDVNTIMRELDCFHGNILLS